MYPHHIRLRGPWQLHAGDSTAAVTLPGTWQAAGNLPADQSVRLSRHFGAPRSIDADESVWLTWANVSGAPMLFLNDRPITPKIGASNADIGDLIKSRNELSVKFAHAPAPHLPLGDFALEIRGRAYLTELSSDPSRRSLGGKIVGPDGLALELYLLADGKTEEYRLVHSSVAGQNFEMTVPEGVWDRPAGDHAQLRLELIEAATLWWRADYPDDFAQPASSATPAG